MKMTTLPENSTRVYPCPVAMTASDAPISRSSAAANPPPSNASGRANSTPRMMAWTAARAAPSGCFSPMRRATIAVAPMPSPIQSA